jgi:hypothetical protein
VPAAGAASTNEYRVVIAGAAYAPASNPKGSRFALRGEHVELTSAEADRLTELGAVVKKGAPDPVRADLSGELGYGGTPLEDPVEHAEKIRKGK